MRQTIKASPKSISAWSDKKAMQLISLRLYYNEMSEGRKKLIKAILTFNLFQSNWFISLNPRDEIWRKKGLFGYDVRKKKMASIEWKDSGWLNHKNLKFLVSA